jgi:hypothetical protein
MPCWEVNLISVEIKAADKDLLEQAIKALGYEYTRNGNEFYIGGLEISGSTVSYRESATSKSRLESIVRQYAIEGVKKKAKATGWKGNWMKLNGENKTGNKIKVKKGW